jgi:rhodanese-related sulfurtransferase
MEHEAPDTGNLEQWTPEEVCKAFRNHNIVLIDVRTPQEYAFEHIEGALLAPMATFKPENLPTQDGKRIVFHCGSGMRSKTVAEACAAAGMNPIAHLAGGFAAWKKAAMPYVTTDPATGGISYVKGADLDLY